MWAFVLLCRERRQHPACTDNLRKRRSVGEKTHLWCLLSSHDILTLMQTNQFPSLKVFTTLTSLELHSEPHIVLGLYRVELYFLNYLLTLCSPVYLFKMAR